MPNKTIKFSPKHGLNPTIPVCFFCGQQKMKLLSWGDSLVMQKPQEI